MYKLLKKPLVQLLAVADISLLLAVLDNTRSVALETLIFLVFCGIITYIAANWRLVFSIAGQIIFLVTQLLLSSHSRVEVLRESLYLLFITGLVVLFQARHKHTTELASIDHLTGVYNRRAIDKHLRDMSTKHHSGKFAIIFVDLDKFKEINDEYGHVAGDKVLIGIGKKLQESIRQIDICSRYGGDEFLIILPSIKSIEEVDIVAQRILKNIEGTFIDVGETKIKQHVSLGIAYAPGDAVNIQDLLQIADQRVYEAKTTGGNKAFNGEKFYSAS